MKRYPAYDPPEYVDWQPDPALVAAGRGDVWLSVAPKSEWDVCAGDLLVHEAGGTFGELARGERRYNQTDVLLNPPLAAGPERLVAELRRIACKD